MKATIVSPQRPVLPPAGFPARLSRRGPLPASITNILFYILTPRFLLRGLGGDSTLQTALPPGCVSSSCTPKVLLGRPTFRVLEGVH